MGDVISQHKPDNVSWEMLRAEIAQLKQDERCEVDVLPLPSNDEEITEHFKNDSFNLRYNRCPKKANHDKFIPINELTYEDLPDYAKSTVVLQFVKTFSPLVVKINCTHASSARPNTKMWKADPLRCGSGFAQQFQFSKDTIWVTTAKHVIFDQSEVEKCTVVFFFDDSESRKLVAKGVSYVTSLASWDMCIFSCKVDSDDFLKMFLKSSLDVFGSFPNETDVPDKLAFGFCISHPHGTFKKVSFGKIVDKSKNSPFEILFGKIERRFYFYLKHLSKYKKIENKKVLYFFFLKEMTRKHPKLSTKYSIFDSLYLSNDEILEELLSQDLIMNPSKAENDYLLQAFNESEEEWQRIKSQNNLKKKYLLPEGWNEKLVAVCKCILGFESLGSSVFSKVKPMKFFRHDAPTCAGSSGSCLFFFENDENGKTTVHAGIHNMGGSIKGNKCGFGFRADILSSSELSKLSPFDTDKLFDIGYYAFKK